MFTTFQIPNNDMAMLHCNRTQDFKTDFSCR